MNALKKSCDGSEEEKKQLSESLNFGSLSILAGGGGRYMRFLKGRIEEGGKKSKKRGKKRTYHAME